MHRPLIVAGERWVSKFAEALGARPEGIIELLVQEDTKHKGANDEGRCACSKTHGGEVEPT